MAGIAPFESKSYTNNFVYYCFNTGKVVGDSRESGALGGYWQYYDADYNYALTGTYSTICTRFVNYKNTTNQKFYDKATLTNTVLSFPENKFKSDYTGNASVNEGFPILSWQ